MDKEKKLSKAKELRAHIKKVEAEIARGFVDQSYATAEEQLRGAKDYVMNVRLCIAKLETGRSMLG